MSNIIEYSGPYQLQRGTPMSSGYDLQAFELQILDSWQWELPKNKVRFRINTGIRLDMTQVAIPIDVTLSLRGGFSFKWPVRQTNAIGVIDQDYTGLILVPLEMDFNPAETTRRDAVLQFFDLIKNQRIAQISFKPVCTYGAPDLDLDKLLFVFKHGLLLRQVDQIKGETERGAGGFGSTG